MLVDRIQIQQVLLNLLRNAIEADGSTPRNAHPHHSRGSVNGEMVELVVADNGPGLAAEVARHLFEPFHSIKAEGMGLGLSICRTIVEAHGGRIWYRARRHRRLRLSFHPDWQRATGGR